MTSPVLDRILQELSLQGRLPQSPDVAGEARHDELRGSGSGAEEYVAKLDQLGVPLYRAEDARALAAAILDEAENERRRIKRDLVTTEEQAARAGWTGPPAQAVKRLRAELLELDEISRALFAAVRPALVKGQRDRDHGVRASTVKCRTCSNKIPRLEAFNARPLGVCATCRAELARPNDEKGGVGGALRELLEQL